MWEIAIVTAVLGTAFILNYISGKLVENHEEIAYFFVMISFLFIGVLLYVTKLIADPNNASIASIINKTYIGYSIVITFISLYFIANFVYNLITSLSAKKKRRQGFE